MKITGDIFQVGSATLSHPNDAAIYLIKDGAASALIDAGSGEGTENVLKNIQDCGVKLSDIKYILITHCHFDHTGGINSLREATGAKVVAHEKDAGFIIAGDMQVTGAALYGGHFEATPVDIIVSEEKKEIKLNKLTVTMYHTPGHSPGSVVFTLKSDDKLVLFGQDVHGPINEIILRSNRTEYEKSLEFLMALDADILCEGHFGVYYGKEQVREFIESFL